MKTGSMFAVVVFAADALAALALALFMIDAMIANQGHRAGWFALACAVFALNALAISLIAEGGAT